jgi:uncharacterized membrane protein
MPHADLAIPPSPGLRGWPRAAWALNALLCAAVALVSYRYLAGVGPVPPIISDNLLVHPWLALHVAGAATALLVGPLQFVARLRARRPAVHRVLGRVYVTGCLVGGVAGLVLAFGAASGPVSVAGFGLLAVLWLATTVQAWRSAVQGRFVEHRAWMIRSMALTYAAVTLRLYLPILQAMPSVPFVEGYRGISFLCWVPNLLLAEAWLRARRARGSVAHA